MSWVDDASKINAPSSVRLVQRLSGTGSTEATNATALKPHCKATLFGGPTALYVKFLGVTGTGSSVSSANYDLELPAYGRYDWDVETGENDFVAVEASDGASVFRGALHTASSP